MGYNYLIDRYGNVYEGRYGGDNVVAGHALCYNRGSVGIALLGDFT
ncbi:MAG TPA: N-acetylmuramoyl-L-alanine amidase, partial [Dehalococcoidia bacterium]|nr:N-acetylmuramoyl-L-alanine amidase [Dehalococcoidia bacterium]